MKTKDFPYTLFQGLYLESDELLIPWRINHDELRFIGHPEITENDNITSFTWRERKILGGTNVDIHTNSSIRNVFYIRPPNSQEIYVEDAYYNFRQKLIENLGEPHSSEVSDGFPSLLWNYGGRSLDSVRVRLGIQERFLQDLVFVISSGF
jgi:hypothetical protein